MGIVTIILLGVLVLVVVWAVMIYNNLVQVKHNVSKAWANIDVLLKQRHDELPKLVETCKQYMKFEQETLTKVMEARSKVFTAREQQNIGALGPAVQQRPTGRGRAGVHQQGSPLQRRNQAHGRRGLERRP